MNSSTVDFSLKSVIDKWQRIEADKAKLADEEFMNSTDEDIISSLPNDCLFAICRYLDCESFATMSRVSQQFYHITTSQGKPKKEFDELTLTLEGDGFIFYLNEYMDEGPCFVYDASAQKVTKRIVAKAIKWDSLTGNGGHQTEAVVDSLFVALDDMLTKFIFFKVTINKLHIDTKFIEKLMLMIGKDKIERLTLNEVTCCESVSLKSLICDSLVQLQVYEGDERMYSMFDENFMRKFSKSCNEGKCDLLVISRDDMEFRWTPTRDFLPVICRYDDLYLESLTLTIPMLMELVSISLTTAKEEASWVFSMGSVLREADFALLNPQRMMNNTTYDDGYIIFVAMLLTAAMISALIVGVCFFRMFWQAVHAMQMCVCCCCEALPPDEYTETEEESRRESESCADISVRVVPVHTPASSPVGNASTPAAAAAAVDAAAAAAAPPAVLPEAPPVYTLHDPVFLARLKHATSKEEKAALLLEKKKREILLGRILLERECGL